jgi:hypothetical protein
MFSKSNQESQKINQPEIEDLILSDSNVGEDKMMTESAQQPPELVKLVEKISGIVSPYFIVIVGLYLYENNFLLGSILIVVGILSLFKVSYEDVWGWIQKIKGFFDKNELDQ